MDQTNPYASPHSDLTRPAAMALDPTGPFDPQGRFTRLSWLAWSLVLGIGSSIAVLALGGLGMAVSAQPDPSAAPLVPLLLLIPQIAAAVLGVLLTIRRFHDIDASGWWAATLLVPVVNLITFLVLTFKRGDAGANRFGPPRPTRDWERVLAIIYIVLFVVAFVGIIAAISIPAYLGQMHP